MASSHLSPEPPRARHTQTRRRSLLLVNLCVDTLLAGFRYPERQQHFCYQMLGLATVFSLMLLRMLLLVLLLSVFVPSF